MSFITLLFSKLQGLFCHYYKILILKFVFEYLTDVAKQSDFLFKNGNIKNGNIYEYFIPVDIHIAKH